MRRIIPVLTALALVACGAGPEKTVTAKVQLHTKGNYDCSTEDTTTVTLTSDQDFDKYKDDLDHAELLAVRLRVTEISPENKATKGSGTATFTATDGSKVTFFTYKDVPIEAGHVENIQYDADAAQKVIEAATHKPWQLTISSVGEGDAPECRFAFTVEMDFKVTAKLSAIL